LNIYLLLRGVSAKIARALVEDLCAAAFQLAGSRSMRTAAARLQLNQNGAFLSL